MDGHRPPSGGERATAAASRSDLPATRHGRRAPVHAPEQPDAETRALREAVRENEERFRTLAESAPVGVLVWDTAGSVTFANREVLAILGRPATDVEGSRPEAHVHPDDLAVLRAQARDAARAGEGFRARIRIIRPCGEVRWVETRVAPAVHDERGRARSFVASVNDVTHDIEREQALERLQVTIESTTDLVTFHDPFGHAFYLNAAARAFLGVDPDGPVPPLGPTDFLDVPEEELGAIGECLWRTGKWQGELDVVGAGGRRMPASIVVVMHRDAAGEVLHFSAMTRDVSDRRAIEQRLARNEAWYRSLVQHAPELTLVCRGDGEVTYVTPSCEALLGYSVDDVLGQRLEMLLPPDSHARLVESASRLIARPGTTHAFEAEVQRRDGERRWFEGTITNLLDDPSVEGIVVNSRDVTDQRRAEEALRGSEVWFRSLAQHSSDMVTVIDDDYRVTYASPSVCTFLGVPSADLIGQPGRLDIYDEDSAEFRAFFAAVRSAPGSTRSHRVRAHRADGEVRVLEMVATNLLAHPDVRGVVLNSRDVTERVAVEAAVLAAEERSRLLLASASDIISIVDPDGTLRYSSPVAERLLGFPEAAGYGETIWDVIHPDDVARVRAVWDRHLSIPGLIRPVEARLMRADGTWMPAEIIANNLIHDPAVCGVVLTTRDVSERHAAEEGLRASQEQLLESETRFRAVVDDQSELVCRYLPDTTLLFVNRAFAEFYGGEPEDHLGRRLLDLFAPRDREAEVARLAAFGPGRDVAMQEEEKYAADGSHHWIQWTDRAFLDEHGHVVEFQSVGRDVTERRRGEQLNVRQAEVLEQIARGGALDDTLRTIALAVEEQFPGHVCVAHLAADDGLTLRPGIGPSIADSFIAGLAARGVSGSCETAVYRAESVYVDDVVGDLLWGEWRDLALGHGFRACWSTPIFASHARRVLGTLALYGREPGLPDPQQVQLLSLFTHLTSLAIERKEVEDRLAHQSLHDPLTSLPNRALFLDRLGLAIARCHRTLNQVAVLFLDLDRFKVVNDSLGHDAGDELLEAAARRLQDVIRPGDTVARFGGDEFVVLCEDLPAAEARDRAVDIARRLFAAVTAPYVVRGTETFVGASIGIAIAHGDERPEELLRDADAAMYHAKELGRNRVELFDDTLRSRALDRHATETALHRALERREFRVFFQPIMALDDGHCVGAEALMRWQHPERGLILPSEFVTLAEETGLIVDIGMWVLEEAATYAARWQHELETQFSISVNLSARQLAQPDLADQIAGVIRRTGVYPGNLCLEITESVLMEDTESTLSAIQRVRSLGVKLGIDDFGTGYSSLGYLKRFPVDSVKIDRSFVDGLGTDAGDTAIVSAVVGLGHALGLQVCAEGVETADQLAALVALGCDHAQGFFFAPPQPVQELRQLLAHRPKWRPGGSLPVAAAGRNRFGLGIRRARRASGPAA